MQNNSEGLFDGAEVWVEVEKPEGVLTFPYKTVK